MIIKITRGKVVLIFSIDSICARKPELRRCCPSRSSPQSPPISGRSPGKGTIIERTSLLSLSFQFKLPFFTSSLDERLIARGNFIRSGSGERKKNKSSNLSGALPANCINRIGLPGATGRPESGRPAVCNRPLFATLNWWPGVRRLAIHLLDRPGCCLRALLGARVKRPNADKAWPGRLSTVSDGHTRSRLARSLANWHLGAISLPENVSRRVAFDASTCHSIAGRQEETRRKRFATAERERKFKCSLEPRAFEAFECLNCQTFPAIWPVIAAAKRRPLCLRDSQILAGA